MKYRELIAALAFPPLLLGSIMLVTAGCENKEEVLDIETPGGQVEVTRDRDTGEVDVDATDDDAVLDIDTPGADVEIRRDADDGGVEVDTDRQ